MTGPSPTPGSSPGQAPPASAGLKGDTITDFSAGDKIVIIGTNFSLSVLGETLSFIGGLITLTGGVELSLVPHDRRNDFNRDSRSDGIWRNDSDLFTESLGPPNGSIVSNDANVLTPVASS